MFVFNKKSLSYDDVYLIAQPQSHISSRSEVPKELNRICVAPMPSVIGPNFVESCEPFRIKPFTHRFLGVDYQIKLGKTNRNSVGSVGIGDTEAVHYLMSSGFDTICIDVANGYLQNVVGFAEKISTIYPQLSLVVGNIHSLEGVALYSKVRKNMNKNASLFFRVGIGNGQVCTTMSEATGFGRGQITEISEVSKYVNELGWENTFVIADGGIRHSADAVKAFAAGATHIMMGSYFAKTFEAENFVEESYSHWGCASSFNKERFGEKRSHCEGKVEKIQQSEYKHLNIALEELWNGIASGVSYSGYASLTDMIGNGVFDLK